MGEFDLNFFAELFARTISFWWVIVPAILLGIIVGAIPGFSAANTHIILLPLTLAIDPEVGLIFMVALYASSRMGAGIPAILVNIPGTAGAAAPLDAMRAAWPEDRPLGIRVSATDWVDGGWDLESTIAFAKVLKQRGCDFIDVSAGGVAPATDPGAEVGAGYQTGNAAEIKRKTGLPTMAVGVITDARQAEHIVRTGQADMVAMARGLMFNPRWAWHAAQVLGAEVPYPPAYDRDYSAFGGGPMRS